MKIHYKKREYSKRDPRLHQLLLDHEFNPPPKSQHCNLFQLQPRRCKRKYHGLRDKKDHVHSVKLKYIWIFLGTILKCGHKKINEQSFIKNSKKSSVVGMVFLNKSIISIGENPTNYPKTVDFHRLSKGSVFKF